MVSIARASLVSLVCLVPTAVFASNGLHPRTPVVWSDVPCMTVVERQSDPVLHLDYGIPLEDTDVTADEVPDSRRHQFLAFCRHHSPQAPLPVWVSAADVDAAEAKDLVPADSVSPEDVLDLSAQWSECFVRITSDEGRREITFATAAQGVNWDTSGLAPGAYMVEGYTWEPPYNIYSSRPGVVKVVDDVTAMDNPPAAAITSSETIVMSDEVAQIEGCVDASPGSTVTAEWAPSGDGPEQNWQAFVADEPVSGEAFAVEFLPPAEARGTTVNIRVTVTDPQDQTYTAYMTDGVIVLLSSQGNCDSGGGSSFVGPAGCDAGSGPATSGPTSDTETGGNAEGTTQHMDSAETGAEASASDTGTDSANLAGDDTGTDRGCSCSTATPGIVGAAMWLILPLARRRRR